MLQPVRVPGAGEKLIQEYAGAASTGQAAMSLARMTAPPGWDEPGQRPQFDEVTYVRYASVYRQFQDVGEFSEVIESLENTPLDHLLQPDLFESRSP